MGRPDRRWLITLGGMNVILAEALVGVFLVWVASPLFFPEQITPAADALRPRSAQTAMAKLDEYGNVLLELLADGTITVTDTRTGKLLVENCAAAYPRPPHALLGTRSNRHR